MKAMRQCIWLLFFIAFLFESCNSAERKIAVQYNVEIVTNNLYRIVFMLENNSKVDYFIPFIKPAYLYSTVRDEDNSRGIQNNVHIEYLLSNGILSRNDLYETGQIDSMYYSKVQDTVIFYFDQQMIKNVYDKILNNSKEQKAMRSIYPFFYHALSNGCVYIKSGETKPITSYVYHYYPLEAEELIVSFNFDTRKNSYYKEKYFSYIPCKIGTYYLFNGTIRTDP